MSAGDTGKAVAKCTTCGKLLEAYEEYLDCPKRRDKPRGMQRQHTAGPLGPNDPTYTYEQETR